jgi:hypothetical protein
MNPAIVDAKKSLSSYDDIGVSTSSQSLEKSASSEILADILKEFSEGGETKEAQEAEKSVAEALGEDEAEKEEEEKKKKKETAEKKGDDETEEEERTAEDALIERELSREAAAYYDLGRWMAFDKTASGLAEVEEDLLKEATLITLHVSNLKEGLVKQAAIESSQPLDDSSVVGCTVDDMLKNASTSDLEQERLNSTATYFDAMGKAAAHGYFDTMSGLSEMELEDGVEVLKEAASVVPDEIVKFAEELEG